MNDVPQKSRGFIKVSLILVALALVGAIAVFSFLRSDSEQVLAENELTFLAVKQNFISSIVESGDVASSSNVDIRCRVRERGGTAVLKIVEEGTRVEEGDFLCQLEDSNF